MPLSFVPGCNSRRERNPELSSHDGGDFNRLNLKTGNLKLRCTTYSNFNFNSKKTFKTLVGVAPCGIITFVSDLFTCIVVVNLRYCTGLWTVK